MYVFLLQEEQQLMNRHAALERDIEREKRELHRVEEEAARRRERRNQGGRGGCH